MDLEGVSGAGIRESRGREDGSRRKGRWHRACGDCRSHRQRGANGGFSSAWPGRLPLRDKVNDAIKEAAEGVATPVAVGVERLVNDAAHRAVACVLEALWPERRRR